MRPLLPPRSTPARDAGLDRLTGGLWDLLVVGGGISGAAVARSGALRGLSVALVEQDDLAAGTSSRSSRLIHGGLRYLAEADFRLVREGLVERRRLLDSAPGLVHPVRFLYPVWRRDPDPLWRVRLGVWLYERLAGRYGLGGRQRLTAGQTAAAVPGLRREGLTGAVAYRDAATHDARLTLALARAAADAGACLLTRVKATGLATREGRVSGLLLEDRVSGACLEARGRAVVLCCGPWEELLRRLPEPLDLRTARGSHLAFTAGRLPLPASLALRSPDDGRLTFALPMHGYSVVGTTDVEDATPPSEVRPTHDDVTYLLRVANHAFPEAALTAADATGVWAGLRPLLPARPSETVGDLSREHRVLVGPEGSWLLAGGKLTTHRRMAEDCLEAVVEARGEAPRRRRTLPRDQPLFPEGPEAGERCLAELGVPEPERRDLVRLYGGRLGRLAARVAAGSGDAAERLLAAQVALAVEEEGALALDDLLLRRLLPGPLDLRAAMALAPAAARLQGEALAWSREDERAQVAAFEREVQAELDAAGLGG